MELNTEPATPDDSSTPSPVTKTIEQPNHPPEIDELQAVNLTFVNDPDVPEAQAQDIRKQDEYEADSDMETDEELESHVVSKACMTRSGRAVRAFVRLDLWGQQYLMAIFQLHLQRN